MKKKSKRSAIPLPNTVKLAKAVQELPDDDWVGGLDEALWTDSIVELGDLAIQLEDARPELSRIASVWSVLLELAQSEEAGDVQQRQKQLCLVTANVDTLLTGLDGDPDSLEKLTELHATAHEQWGETLKWLVDDQTPPELEDDNDLETLSERELLELNELEEALMEAEEELAAAGESFDGDATCDSTHEESPDPQQLEAALAAMAERTLAEEPPPMPLPPGSTPAPAETNSSKLDDEDPLLEGDLLEAFLDDAQRCLAGLQEASLSLEADANDAAAVKQIGRELHTLKGASACVGLQQLASEVHEAEGLLQYDKIDVMVLLSRVDDISRKVESIGKVGAANSSVDSTVDDDVPTASASTLVEDDAQRSLPNLGTATGEPTQRIRTSQLDRLMDMLAELVMLRNRRQSSVEHLGQIGESLVRAVEHLKRLTGKVAQSLDGYSLEDASSGAAAAVGSLGEVAEDLTDSLRDLRGFYEPLARDNESVSNFIGQFRHQLAALRRMPVAGLFHKLRRVARDAARVENKEVQLNFVGEDFGLEPAIQERLYEPLLHIVRNSVGHGIESPDQRVAAGKPRAGQVTLEASGSGHLVHLEIRDDGRGLDYEAIRRRGVERKLLSPNRPVSREELAQLIFHPGFSTRDAVSQVSGRGVGMDVVAVTLEQLRGWIDVSSTQDKGTTVRISLPLPSVIQHMMVFRSGGQLYGVTMECLEFAGAQEGPQCSEVPAIADLLAGPQQGVADGEEDTAAQYLWIHMENASPVAATEKQRRALPLRVEEIVGPEEAVVRPLPPLLRHHPLVSGLSLSGNGEVVQLLDSHGLARQIANSVAGQEVEEAANAEVEAIGTEPTGRAVLVVDDSKTARLRIARPIAAAGIEVVQACDGVEALEMLNSKPFAVVFTDLEMPVMDGFELLAELQSQGASETPVIVASTLQHASHQQRTRELGAAAHLGKPLDDATVLETLRELAPQLGI